MRKAIASQHVEIRIPSGVSADLRPIAKEVHRIHEAALWSAQGQFEQAKIWRSLNILLGVPAATLAAISGGVGLGASEQLTWTAVLALIAAGFGAALTTLNPSQQISQAQSAANAYLEIQTTARQLLTIDLLTADPNTARTELDELTARRDEVNKTADPPGRWARSRASAVIRSGGQAYEIDRSGEES